MYLCLGISKLYVNVYTNIYINLHIYISLCMKKSKYILKIYLIFLNTYAMYFYEFQHINISILTTLCRKPTIIHAGVKSFFLLLFLKEVKTFSRVLCLVNLVETSVWPRGGTHRSLTFSATVRQVDSLPLR